jgi:hypothetical protein
LTESRLGDRRSFLFFVLFCPLVQGGCGTSQDGAQVHIGDATKAEAKARAELYKERALLKRKVAAKR